MNFQHTGQHSTGGELFFKFVEPDGSILRLCLYLCLFPVIRAVPFPANYRIASTRHHQP